MKNIRIISLILSTFLLVSLSIITTAESVTIESNHHTDSIDQNTSKQDSSTSNHITTNSNIFDSTDSTINSFSDSNEVSLFVENQAFLLNTQKKLVMYNKIDGNIIRTIENADELLLPVKEKHSTQHDIWIRSSFDNKDIWLKNDSPILFNENITEFSQSSNMNALANSEGDFFSSLNNVKENTNFEKIDLNDSFTIVSSFKFNNMLIFQVHNRNNNFFGFFRPFVKHENDSSEKSHSSYSLEEQNKSSEQITDSSQKQSQLKREDKAISIAIVSTWNTNYAMRFYQGGHGIHNQPWGLPNTLTYGNSSNHINRAVTITQAKLLSNGETYYQFSMDNRTYWSNSNAFTDANRPYVTSSWTTNYAMRFYQGGHGIHNQPWGLPNTLTYGNSSNHINRAVTITQAKLLSNGETYYQFSMDNRTYWSNFNAFTDANKPYIVSSWSANYPVRISSGGIKISNIPSPLSNSTILGNSSNHLNKRVLITQASLLSNGETYYRYSMDNKIYWSLSSAFANRYTARDVLNMASKYIGVTSNPRGSRNNMFNTAFYGIPVSSYTSIYDWCAVYIWYVLREAGLSEEYYGGIKTRWVAPIQSWYKSENRWSKRPYAGNLIFFSWHDGVTADHVGFIEHVNSDGSLTIIDGNVNDDVQRRRVSYVNNWNVVGFGAINYN
ncbi:GW dipeptide domain-containing protein [Enterococcus avium]|uniref:GW dipeptide domain-containing protein n=1 Tax=Enterococcus avium TaxID=33945 RepID=UPI0034D30781